MTSLKTVKAVIILYAIAVVVYKRFAASIRQSVCGHISVDGRSTVPLLSELLSDVQIFIAVGGAGFNH